MELERHIMELERPIMELERHIMELERHIMELERHIMELELFFFKILVVSSHSSSNIVSLLSAVGVDLMSLQSKRGGP